MQGERDVGFGYKQAWPVVRDTDPDDTERGLDLADALDRNPAAGG